MSAENKSDQKSILHSEELQKLVGIDTIQLLKCGICWEFYDNPIVLPCGHTFCYDCLLEMGKHARKNKTHVAHHDLQIACPNCRQPIKVIALTLRQVTNNYALQSLLDTLISIPYVATKRAEKKMVDASTNTKKDSKTYAFNKEKLDDIETDITNAFEHSHRRSSVIHEAKDEIDKIREEFKKALKDDKTIMRTASPIADVISKINRNDNAKQELEDKNKVSDICDRNKITNSAGNGTKEPVVSGNNLGFDPAILSYSIKPQTQFSFKRQGLLPPTVPPVGLGGWVYARQTVNF